MRRSSSTRARAASLLVLLTAAFSGVGVGAAGAASAEGEPEGRVFHISSNGSDTADGRTPATAWRSLERANRHTFTPGDQLLLQGGATFPGWLYLDASDAGDAAAPVVVGSYGVGRAVIQAAGNPGVYVYNTAGITIRDLTLVGDRASYGSKGGISLYNDLTGDQRLPGVTVHHVEVSGFRHGIDIGGARGASGFRDVTVRDASLHDNRDAGLITYGPAFAATSPTYAHADVRVSRVSAFRNVGNPAELHQNTGNGIVLGSVTGGVVERSTAYENGSACAAPEGPAGIWTYDSHQIRIEHNVSYRNRTGGPADGDGFDLDQNVSSSVLQYNLSYENAGAGYLIWTAKPNTAHRDNTVRFNISSNDARKIGWYGGITLSGNLLRTQVYGNTVWMTGAATRAPALRLDQALSGVSVRDNVLVVDSAGPVVAGPAFGSAAVTLHGNDYFAPTGTFSVQWGSKSYGSVAAWQGATGVEMLSGRSTALSVDPGLVDPRTPVGVTDATGSAPGFMLSPTSALRGRGVDLTAGGTVAVGPTDHFGTPLAGSTSPYDVGAHQPSQSGAAASAPAILPQPESAPEQVTPRTEPAPGTEQVPAPVVTGPVTAPVVPAPVVTEPVTAPVVTEPVTAPVVTEPVTAPVVTEPVTAVAGPVTSPPTAPVVAPVTVPAVAPEASLVVAPELSAETAQAVVPTLSLSPAVISAGQSTRVTHRGTPGSTLEILARTQPATGFSKIGTVTLNADGIGTSTHKPQKNTRIATRTAAGRLSADAPLIAVRSVASVNAKRIGTRTFAFTGRVYPALDDRLVNVYRNGVLVGQGRTDGKGVYRIARTLGAGTFTFQVRTPNDRSNLGASSQRLRVAIR